MKAARLVVLGVAIAAGGLAALLAGGDGPAPPPKPVVQLETVDVLIAQKRHRHGHSVSAADIKWQMWPAAAAGAEHDPQDRTAQRHRGRLGLDRARRLFDRRADPGSQADQGQRLRLHGRHAAQRHARDLDRNLAGNRRPEASSCPATASTSSCLAATSRPRKRAASRRMSARRSSRMSACSRSTRRSRKRTARKSWSARPRRSNWRRARPKSSQTAARTERFRSRCAASSTGPAKAEGPKEDDASEADQHHSFRRQPVTHDARMIEI